MSQPVGKRQLQFELLELRAMLAGNVLVSVVGGDLRVDGDDQSNVLELQQLSASDPRAVSGGLRFRITPDADTSINRSDPGTEIVVSGVTRDIAVAMGGGGDELSLLGATGRQVQNLVIEAGDGPDAVSITGFKLTGDVNISAADSLDVSVEQSTGAAIAVKVENNDRESEDGADTRTSSVTIRNSNLRRSVNVSSDGPLAVNTHGTTIGFPDVCKVPAPPAPPVPIPYPCGNLSISSGAPLSADINQARASDVFVKIADIEGEPKDGADTRTSSVTIRNSNLRRSVNVSSDGPLAVNTHGISIGYPDVCKVPAPPAPPVPVPYPCGNLNISSGAPLSAEINQTRASDVFVKIADIEGEPKDGAETRTSAVTIRNSNLRRSVNVSSDGPLAVNTHGTTIGFPDVCKVPAPPAPPVPVPYPCGNLNISSGAPLSAEINQTRASDVFVKIADIEGEPRDGAEARTSAVTIRNSNLRRDVNVSSDAPLSVNIEQTKAKGDLLIQAVGAPVSSDLRGTEFTNTIRVVDSVFGSLKVIGSESRDEVSLVRLHVLGGSHIDMGGGNDFLAAVDSLFRGFAVLDGGDDADSLILLGTQFRRGSRTVNWE